MSTFLEEYGKVIVVIIIVAALIGLALWFKKTGTENATSSFNSFMNTASQAANENGNINTPTSPTE